MSLVINPEARRTAHELVRDTLRRAILTGEIPGGERLVQADLAHQLQVSTTPVREAFRDLAAEGLIRLDPRRGAVVHSLTQAEIEEIYRIRQLLEPELMGQAIELMGAEDLERAAALQHRADAESETGAWVELGKAFHRVFNKACGLPRLGSIVEGLQDSGTSYVIVALNDGTLSRDEMNRQHWELLEAVRSRDVDRARQVVLEHIHKPYALVPADSGAARRRW